MQPGETNEEQQETQSETTSQSIVESGTCGDNLTWTLDSEGTLEITGSGSMTDYGAAFGVEKPWKECKEDIISVLIGDEVTSIGYAAFSYCYNLESVIIGESVASIGSGAFRECESLTELVLPESVNYIYEYAFDTCSALKYVTIENNGSLCIQKGAFYHCSNITDVYYSGSEEEWENIQMGRNSDLEGATIHYQN